MKICNICGFANNDNASICERCASPLDENGAANMNRAPSYETQQQTFGSGFQPAYQQNPYFNQPYYGYIPQRAPKTSKAKIITFLVLGLIFGSFLGSIGLPFAVVALAAFTEYKSALAQDETKMAQRKLEIAEKFGRVSMILTIVGIALSAIIFVGYILTAILLFNGEFSTAGFFDTETYLSVMMNALPF